MQLNHVAGSDYDTPSQHVLPAVLLLPGLGGGKTGDYRTPADSSYTVAASPYWGVDGVYSSSMDPWQKSDNRQFMQQYYQLTTEYAKRGGVNYPVSARTAMLDCTYSGTPAVW